MILCIREKGMTNELKEHQDLWENSIVPSTGRVLCTVHAGGTISRAFSEALRVAQERRRDVEFIFNQYRITIEYME